MHIEIFTGEKIGPKSPDRWYWHKVNNNGKITCNSEAFPSKAHALRAAKADVTHTIKPYTATNALVFVLVLNIKSGMFILRWSCRS